MDMNAKGVAVVVPHYERLTDTVACCASLAAQTYGPTVILVVDNGSRGHSVADLAAACPVARVIRLETNRGFAGGVNAGLRAGLADPGVAYAWLLNNDTVCAPDALARLVACAQTDERIGMVGCQLREGRDEATRRLVPAGKNLMWPWGIPVHARSERLPDYLCGASLLVRRALLDDIGLLDEGYYFFFEDADFSLRARRSGWKLAVARGASVVHAGSATIRELTEMQARCYRAGHVRFLRKFSRRPLFAAAPPFLARLLLDACRGHWTSVRGACVGWREGWRQSVP
ncbi:MAG: glycosyltransferase family 2 protein [Kiritimatiellae bacterium]|nr:glycosyltransferase family 2 protein [Kiritimatiellia bacterium]